MFIKGGESMSRVGFLFILLLWFISACAPENQRQQRSFNKNITDREFVALEQEGSSLNSLIRFKSSDASSNQIRIIMEREDSLTADENELIQKLGIQPSELVSRFGNVLEFHQKGFKNNKKKSEALLGKGIYGCTETIELSTKLDASYCLKGDFSKENQSEIFEGELEVYFTKMIDNKTDEGRKNTRYSEFSLSLQFKARSNYAFYTQYLGFWKGTVDWISPSGAGYYASKGFGKFEWLSGGNGFFLIHPSQTKIEFDNIDYTLKQPVITLKNSRFISSGRPQVDFFYYSHTGEALHIKGTLSSDVWRGSIFLEPSEQGEPFEEKEVGRFLYLKD